MGDSGYGKSSLGASFVKAGLSPADRRPARHVLEDGTVPRVSRRAARRSSIPAIAKSIFGPRVNRSAAKR